MKQRASIKRQKFLKFFIYLTMLGLRCVAGAFSSCGERGILLIIVRAFSWRWFLLSWSMGPIADRAVTPLRDIPCFGKQLRKNFFIQERLSSHDTIQQLTGN